jgi:hypothetical protein
VRLAVHQPNYAPWCGYFAKMRECDIFVLQDDVEISTGQSYVYRTRVRDANGPFWLSVPTHRQLHELIGTVSFADTKWQSYHIRRLQATYHKAAFTREVLSVLGPIYEAPGRSLADFNMRLIRAIAAYLGLRPEFVISSNLGISGQADERLIALAKKLGARTYLSGKGGQNYQDPARFAAAGIDLVVREYQPVPYSQVHGPFLGGLSILDALFNLGQGAEGVLRYS